MKKHLLFRAGKGDELLLDLQMTMPLLLLLTKISPLTHHHQIHELFHKSFDLFLHTLICQIRCSGLHKFLHLTSQQHLKQKML